MARTERFAPGTVLAGRYRLLGLAGRGGMGEVYRAEDVRLGQEVALKFLPRDGGDEVALGRLLAETRLARQVSHPNVVRTYDVGEVDGQAFISMEFVDGEDFASLLKRIGRLPQDKAHLVAQQLCAGLAAAHDRGILHRDLKPANVMLDGHGEVRIADFGLSGLAEELVRERVRAGTPAYMAPEQLLALGVSQRSDLYSLGLVLFELYTGRPAFQPQSVEELERLHREPAPSPTGVMPHLDPAVDRAILWCLERDPAKRPADARTLASALPGGNPLAAALLAGRTPSPGQVAAAGAGGRISGRAAVGACVVMLLTLVTALALAGRAQLVPRAPLPLSLPVLANKAEEILGALRLGRNTPHEAYGFDRYEEYLEEVQARDRSAGRWDRLSRTRPAAIDFWFRQSPRPLVTNRPGQRVTMQDPPLDVAGMVAMRLDPEGRLRELAVVTLQDSPSGPPGGGRILPDPDRVADPDWRPLFGAAGLDPAVFAAVEPQRIPPMYVDLTAAWEGVYPESPDERIRVEAAAVEGRPVAFRVVELNWPGAAVFGVPRLTPMQRLGRGLEAVVKVASLAGAMVLAWRNVKFRRGDRVGAFRVSAVMFALSLGTKVLTADHVLSVEAEGALFMASAGRAAQETFVYWLVYMALEPHVRRLWPEMMISWSRLVAGRWRDPLVGLNLVAGGIAGTTAAVLVYLDQMSPPWTGHPPAMPFSAEGAVTTLAGGARPLGVLLGIAFDGTMFAMVFLLGLVLLKLLCRRRWLAIAAYGVVQTSVWALTAVESPLSWVIFGVLTAVCTVTLVRFGVLALAVAATFALTLTTFPAHLDFSPWYTGAVVLALATLGGLFVFGVGTSSGLIASRERAVDV